MEQNQFKESGCLDVDEAKFKQTVSVWTPKKVRVHTKPLESFAVAGEAPPLPF